MWCIYSLVERLDRRDFDLRTLQYRAPAMTLPLAIRPRIRLRDEPERSRAAWLPPKALPIAVYWGVMGFLTYSVSRAPSWLPSEEARLERSAVDTSLVQQLTGVAVARSEMPPARSEPQVPREAPIARHETSTVRATFDEAPMPPTVAETPPRRPLLEPLPGPSIAARLPHEAEPARDARRSRRKSRAARDTVDTTPPPLLTMYNDPIPRDSFTMHGISALTTSVPAPSDAPPATARPMPHRRSTLPGCESVAAAASNEWDLTAAPGAPDLSRDAYAAVLENGAYLSGCAVPAGTALDICAAVQKGRPLGITVVAHPPNPQVSACVKAAVESLSFPSHPRLDVTRTHFEALSGR